MVNVEADVMVGPILAEKAAAKGLIYSMAYGDQPALICELVDWARATGFEVTAAGKGMNFEPRYRYSTPDTVWGFFGWTEEEVAKGDFNPKMYNSFTDGTKAAIEMAAVANGTGLDCPDDGLAFPPAGLHDLAQGVPSGRRWRPHGAHRAWSTSPPARSRTAARCSTTSATASSSPSRRTTNIRRACFKQYGLLTDPSGWYASMWRPFHIIGLETSVSVLSAVLRNEADRLLQGIPRRRRGHRQEGYAAGRDARRRGRLRGLGQRHPGDAAALSSRALPIGLAHNVKLKRAIKKDQIVSFDDVELVNDLDVVPYASGDGRALPPGPLRGGLTHLRIREDRVSENSQRPYRLRRTGIMGGHMARRLAEAGFAVIGRGTAARTRPSALEAAGVDSCRQRPQAARGRRCRHLHAELRSGLRRGTVRGQTAWSTPCARAPPSS